MNNVALVGRLTADVELRTAGDKAFAMFTVAVNRPFKNKETNEYDADFIRCKAFGGTAEFIAKFFGKGKPIGVGAAKPTKNTSNHKPEPEYEDVEDDSYPF